MAELKKYIFCNVAWMEYYEGEKDRTDKTLNGGSGGLNGEKYEICNFAKHEKNKFCYGYVQPGGKKDHYLKGRRINLERIASGDPKTKPKLNPNIKSEEDYLTGVLVIWTATRPQKGGTFVVGWYKNATVFREYQEFGSSPPCHDKKEIPGYRIQVDKGNAEVILGERNIRIPRSTKNNRIEGGIGRNVWYGDSPPGHGKRIVAKLLGKMEDIKQENRAKAKNK